MVNIMEAFPLKGSLYRDIYKKYLGCKDVGFMGDCQSKKQNVRWKHCFGLEV